MNSPHTTNQHLIRVPLKRWGRLDWAHFVGFSFGCVALVSALTIMFGMNIAKDKDRFWYMMLHTSLPFQTVTWITLPSAMVWAFVLPRMKAIEDHNANVREAAFRARELELQQSLNRAYAHAKSMSAELQRIREQQYQNPPAVQPSQPVQPSRMFLESNVPTRQSLEFPQHLQEGVDVWGEEEPVESMQAQEESAPRPRMKNPLGWEEN